MIRPSLRRFARLWFTGLLAMLAAVGYVFYGFLWAVRFVQSTRWLQVALGAALLAVIGAAVYLYVPLRPPGEQITFVVEHGESLRSVAGRLSREKVIPSEAAFLLWMRATGKQRRVQAGEYTFTRYEGITAAGRALMTARPVEVILALPEGLTVEETARRVGSVLNLDTTAFLRLCTDSAFARELGIEAPTLEGYLFPETYRFLPSVSAAEVIRRMVGQFKQRYASVVFGSEQARALTQRQLVTLASIVGKEAILDEERPRIAAVFYNRLGRDEPLGADPTVRYILRKPLGPLHVSELRVPSPYNTRIHAGLPPGPICSPGFRSLAATAAPATTSELYFVARWDGSGAHDFSVSQEEHDRKKRAIRRMNESRLSTSTGNNRKTDR